MATTLTAVMLEGNRLGMLHVGDSRAYLLRLGVLYQLSHDDTYVQSLVDRRLLTIEQAHAHPERHILVKAWSDQNTIPAQANFEVRENDWLLLCSDGVSDVLREADLAEIAAGPDLNDCADRAVAAAIARGSRDNVTCIIARVVSATGSEPPQFAGAAV